MPAQSLNHYTIKVRDLERTKDFYQDVVGLTVGDRPPLRSQGIGCIAVTFRRCI